MRQADAFIPYQIPVPSRRPTSVLVLGVLGIVLASLTFFSVLVAIAMMIVARIFPSFAAVLAASGPEVAWLVVQSIAAVAFCAVLLWTCVAAIRLRPWARVGLLRWAWVYIAWLAVETTIGAVWAIPASLKAAATATPTTPIPAAPATTVPPDAALEYIFLAISVVLNVIYPVFVLVYMRKPHVRDAFEEPPPLAERAGP